MSHENPNSIHLLFRALTMALDEQAEAAEISGQVAASAKLHAAAKKVEAATESLGLN